jgi:hypothetical protein
VELAPPLDEEELATTFEPAGDTAHHGAPNAFTPSPFV